MIGADHAALDKAATAIAPDTLVSLAPRRLVREIGAEPALDVLD